jgi:hypothetical protein
MNEQQHRAADGLRADRAAWQSLVEDVGAARMDEPGPMGDWTFKDLASHLAGWRNRRIAELEAAVRGAAERPAPWPSELEDDDSINAWIRARDRDRTADDVVADYDASFERLAAAIRALPEGVATDPNRFPWTEGVALVDGDFGEHLRDHAAAVREWLARR